jgi:hypothetical protein
MHSGVRQLLLAALVLTFGLLPGSVEASSTSPTAGPVVISTAASGDWRCFYGPGIQVWEDANKGGATMILCGTRGYWKDLWNLGESLNGGRWADRLSSFETFNTNLGGSHAFRLCVDPNDSGSCYQSVGTQYVSYVGSALNDKISSIRDVILTS